MYSVSNDFLTKVASASRQFVARMSATSGFLVDSDEVYLTDADGYFLINGVVPETSDIPSDKFLSFTISGGTNSEKDFSLGSCVSQCLNVELNGNKLITQGAEYLLEIGLVLDDDSIEYIPMGYFIAQKPETTEHKTTATLYDRMIFLDAIATPASTLPETTTTLAVLALIEDTLGIPVDTAGLTAISMTRPDTTKSWRTALQTIAQLYGGFAVIDRDGNLCIKKYDFNTTVATIGADRYTAFTHADANYTLLNLYVITGYDANGAEVAYSSGTGTGGIFFNNADMTQALLDSIYAYYENMSYMPSEISSMLGRPEIDVWDCISVTDMNGDAFTVPLMSRELSFDGGMTDSISAYGKSEAEQLNAYQSVLSNLLQQTNGLLDIVAKKINFAVEGQYLSSTFEISDSAITSITDKFVIKGSDGTTTVISGGEFQTHSVTADDINVSDLFAQNITASGTITGVTIYCTDADGGGLVCTSSGGLITQLNSDGLHFASEGVGEMASILFYQGGVEIKGFAGYSDAAGLLYVTGASVEGTQATSHTDINSDCASIDFMKPCHFIYGTGSGSDERIKHDITTLETNEATEFIYALKPVSFYYNDGWGDDKKHHGFIAQDVKKLVSDDDSIIGTTRDRYMLQYQEIIARLVATVQSQNERITALENKIKELEANNE